MHKGRVHWPARFGLSTLALAALLLSHGLALPADAAGRKKSGRSPGLQVPLPAPGNVSVETLKVTLKGKGRNRLPKRLRLKAKKTASLPPSVRVVYAQRRIRTKRSTTYALVLLTINVAAPQAKPSFNPWARVSAEGGSLLSGGEKTYQLEEMATFLLFMGSPIAAEYLQRDANLAIDERDDALHANANALLSGNANLAPPAQAAQVGKVLADLFSGLPDNSAGLVFDQAPKIGNPNLDTGHYDDGHSFGWKVKSKADELNVLANLDAFSKGLTSQLVSAIETDIGADINGDGITGGAPGQTIDTTIGNPIITSP
jgi:hypothetical protein